MVTSAGKLAALQHLVPAAQGRCCFQRCQPSTYQPGQQYRKDVIGIACHRSRTGLQVSIDLAREQLPTNT